MIPPLAPPILENAMRQACAEARRFMGATSPNPPVGALALDAEGRELARAAHERAGTAHAETLVLDLCRRAGTLTRLHTLVVTLEPCAHQGRTPPCVDALLAAEIPHIAIGTRDPNPAVPGKGLERLQAERVEVTLGVEENLCRQTAHAFLYSVQTGLPWVTIKRALDTTGSMIPPKGTTTFTSPESLRRAHLLRKGADAVLTGSGTLLADSPLFTVRHVPDYPGKTRFLVVLDRRRRVPEAQLEAFRARGFTPLRHDAIEDALSDLAGRGVRSVLVEAGPTLSEAVLARGLWTMDAVVHAKPSGTDRWEVRWNPLRPPPFQEREWTWANLLPQET